MMNKGMPAIPKCSTSTLFSECILKGSGSWKTKKQWALTWFLGKNFMFWARHWGKCWGIYGTRKQARLLDLIQTGPWKSILFCLLFFFFILSFFQPPPIFFHWGNLILSSLSDLIKNLKFFFIKMFKVEWKWCNLALCFFSEIFRLQTTMP